LGKTKNKKTKVSSRVPSWLYKTSEETSIIFPV